MKAAPRPAVGGYFDLYDVPGGLRRARRVRAREPVRARRAWARSAPGSTTSPRAPGACACGTGAGTKRPTSASSAAACAAAAAPAGRPTCCSATPRRSTRRQHAHGVRAAPVSKRTGPARGAIGAARGGARRRAASVDYICSDHGMADVTHHVDVMGEVAAVTERLAAPPAARAGTGLLRLDHGALLVRRRRRGAPSAAIRRDARGPGAGRLLTRADEEKPGASASPIAATARRSGWSTTAA